MRSPVSRCQWTLIRRLESAFARRDATRDRPLRRGAARDRTTVRSDRPAGGQRVRRPGSCDRRRGSAENGRTAHPSLAGGKRQSGLTTDSPDVSAGYEAVTNLAYAPIGPVELLARGNRGAMREARGRHSRRFPGRYDGWTRRPDVGRSGTALTVWPSIGPSDAGRLPQTSSRGLFSLSSSTPSYPGR